MKDGVTGAEVLARHGVTLEPAAAVSTARFPDGAHFRIEIPSVEGPAVLRAVVTAAAAAGVTVNRVSQGSSNTFCRPMQPSISATPAAHCST